MVMCLFYRSPQKGGQLSVRAFSLGPCLIVSGHGRQASLAAYIALERNPAFAARKWCPGSSFRKRYAQSCSRHKKIDEQRGAGDAFGLCAYGQDIQASGFDLRKHGLRYSGGGG